MTQQEEKYAIRFGLGAIKAVGLGMMEKTCEERNKNGKFVDIFDFAKRIDSKSVNKKSIEALSKAGAFDSVAKNRRQIFESFDLISSYSIQQQNEANSDQMSFLGALIDEKNSKPELKKVENWNKKEKLQKEFEAFGFFLNEHPLDDVILDLQKRGAVFSSKIEQGELEDGNLIKIAGVIASSKHRSSAKGRFAYLTISDPFGIFEAMIFDEALITKARDILVDGSAIALECLIRKDDGGIRILVRDIKKLEDFISNTKPQDKPFEDIKKQPQRRNNFEKKDFNNFSEKNFSQDKNPQSLDSAARNPHQEFLDRLEAKKIFTEVEIFIENREAIIAVKSFLATRQAPQNFSKATKFLIRALKKDGAIVDLGTKYLLDENDISRLKTLGGVEVVRAG